MVKDVIFIAIVLILVYAAGLAVCAFAIEFIFMGEYGPGAKAFVLFMSLVAQVVGLVVVAYLAQR